MLTKFLRHFKALSYATFLSPSDDHDMTPTIQAVADGATAMAVRLPLVNIASYEDQAATMLPASAVKAHLGTMGAPTWATNTNNVMAFGQWVIRPRILTGVFEPVLATSVLGQPISLPVIIGPVGGHQRFHAEGELATARGAARAHTIMTLSTGATFDIEETRAATDAQLWFQLYVMRSRAISAQLVKRAEVAGYGAIMLTVDNITGHRARSLRNQYAGIKTPQDVSWPTATADRVMANFREYRGTADMPSSAYGEMFDGSLTWTDIAWLRGITQLPIILKGVQTAEDAELAIAHGVDAIVVSNHGGVPAALDGLGGTLHSLTEVSTAVNGRIEIYLDGGVRQGSDVLKALALGARAVLVGRPAMWGLTVAGEAGVVDVLDILRSELSSAMCLTGVADVKQVSRSVVGVANI